MLIEHLGFQIYIIVNQIKSKRQGIEFLTHIHTTITSTLKILISSMDSKVLSFS
jgi:RNA binding exosome subunit